MDFHMLVNSLGLVCPQSIPYWVYISEQIKANAVMLYVNHQQLWKFSFPK